MKSRLLFRQSGYAIEAQPSLLSHVLWTAASITFIVGVLAFSAARDRADARRLDALMAERAQASTAYGCPAVAPQHSAEAGQ